MQLDAYAQTSDMTSQLVIVYDGIATRSGLFLNIADDSTVERFHAAGTAGQGDLQLLRQLGELRHLGILRWIFFLEYLTMKRPKVLCNNGLGRCDRGALVEGAVVCQSDAIGSFKRGTRSTRRCHRPTRKRWARSWARVHLGHPARWRTAEARSEPSTKPRRDRHRADRREPDIKRRDPTGSTEVKRAARAASLGCSCSSPPHRGEATGQHLHLEVPSHAPPGRQSPAPVADNL